MSGHSDDDANGPLARGAPPGGRSVPLIRLNSGRRDLPIGLVVVDLDRTLTDRRLRVQPAALKALEQVRRHDVPIVLATGRTLKELRPRRRLLQAFDGLILEGGGLIGRPDDLRPVRSRLQPLETLKDWLRENRIEYRFGATCLSIPRADARRLQRFPDLSLFQVVPNRDRIDVTLRGVDKGAGLRNLRRRPLAVPGRVLAFGDGENDVPLFRAADYGVAVANATPALLAEADETTRHYGGRGVADFLQTRLLREDGR